MEKLQNLLPNIFLDVGHMYGAKLGAAFGDIEEGPYNDSICRWIYSLWEKRALIDQLISGMPGVLMDMLKVGVHKTVPYLLTRSSENPPILLGRYDEKARHMPAFGVNAHIQMHLNAGKGKYALVGYKDEGPHRETAKKMAQIFAETLENEFSRFPGLITHVRVDACSSRSTEGLRRRIFYCLERSPVPAILIEPLFLDNPKHNEFLVSQEGKAVLGVVYMKAMERIAEVLKEEEPEDA